jgi:serine protease Do
MQSLCLRWIACALAAVGVVASALSVQAQYARRTPIVDAVEKTSGAIVSLKVEKKGQFGRGAELVGAAVVVDERGYAVTNRHVILAASRIEGCLPDGEPIPVQVVVEVPSHDLAVIKLEAERTYRAMPLGPSSDLMVGETVLAVGNPYGYAHSVTRGIISALNREIKIPGGETLRGLIQTDAPINPGSSGGPLININGELIGMNVAMRDGAQGIGFAIPSETIKAVLAAQLSAKKISGVEHGLACQERIAADGVERQRVIVKGLEESSLAAHAGLRPGDEIVQVAGRAVRNRFDVERALWDVKPGEKVTFLVDRSGARVNLTVLLPKGSASR